MLTAKQEIAGESVEYYKQLCSPEIEGMETQLRHYLQDLNYPQVTNAQNQYLTAPITVEEISKVIQKLKPDKSTGRGEFYREFKVQLTPILYKAFNWALTHEI